jgi:hypothetical protein
VTRRQAIARAAAAPLALAAPSRAGAITLDEVKRLEREAVAAAVAAEQTSMVALEAIANGGLLDDRSRAVVRLLLAHATEHAELMAEEYEDALDDEPPLPPSRTGIPGLAGLRRQGDALRLAARLHETAIAAHLAALRRTHKAELVKTIAGVLGSDGQSLVVLRQLLGRVPVPSAFERGRP